MNNINNFRNDCPVCLETAIDTENNRKILDCGHGICKRPCLTTLLAMENISLNEGGQHLCPLCRQVSQISPGELVLSLKEKVKESYQEGLLEGQENSPLIVSSIFSVAIAACSVALAYLSINDDDFSDNATTVFINTFLLSACAALVANNIGRSSFTAAGSCAAIIAATGAINAAAAIESENIDSVIASTFIGAATGTAAAVAGTTGAIIVNGGIFTAFGVEAEVAAVFAAIAGFSSMTAGPIGAATASAISLSINDTTTIATFAAAGAAISAATFAANPTPSGISRVIGSTQTVRNMIGVPFGLVYGIIAAGKSLLDD